MKEKGMLIVLEGACDGIGKSTQFNILKDKLISLGYDVKSHHFPSYNTFHGLPVEKYLAGTFGKAEDLNPYFINNLYAEDRACAWYLELKKAYDDGSIILLDRYTTSSLLYQASTIKDKQAKIDFIDYVNDYEYNKLGIAKPDIVIFLEAPFDLVNKMRLERTEYEGNSKDIHESNLSFLKEVYNNALFVADYLNWDKVECSSQSEMKSIDEIHALIFDKVKTKIFKK